MKITRVRSNQWTLFSFVLIFLSFYGSVQAALPPEDGGVHFITNDQSTVSLNLGENFSNNAWTITNGAVLTVSNTATIGHFDSSTNNRLTVSSGSGMTVGTVDTERWPPLEPAASLWTTAGP